MKTFINFLLLTLFAVTAQARVFNATEEIRLQPTGGVFVESASLSASQPLKLGASKEMVTGAIDLTSEVTGVLPIANGGTGSATQNFVDLSTNQSVSGSKTFLERFVASSTTEGFLPCPVMTEVQRDAIASPVEGDCIYNSDTDLINVYDGASWQLVGGVSGLTANLLTYGAGDGTLEQDSNLSYVSGSTTLTIQDLDLVGNNTVIPEIKSTGVDQDLGISANGTGSVLVENVAIQNDVVSSGINNGDINLQGNGTGEIVLNDSVVFVSSSAPGTPDAGSFTAFADTDPSTGLVFGPYFKDSNGVEKPVDAEIARNVIANGSFEESHAGDPDVGWVVSGSVSNAIETTFRIASEGKQALSLTPSAEGFEYSQTFSCTRYPAVPVGFTVYVQSNTPNIQVCGYDGTNDINCVDVDSDATYKQYLAENSGGGTCGIKIKSTANVTGQVYIDGAKFTDQPYRFVDVQNTTDWVNSGASVITATTTAPTKGTIVRDNVYWRRVGDSMEIRLEFEQSSAGTAGSGSYLLTIPGGYQIDTSKVHAPASIVHESTVGDFHVSTQADGESNVSATGNVSVYDSTRVKMARYDGGANDFRDWSSTQTNFLNATLVATAHFVVPIEGWSATSEHVATPSKSSEVTEQFLSASYSGAPTDLADLQFNNLEVGKWYFLSGQFYMTGNSVDTFVKFYSGAGGTGTQYGSIGFSRPSANLSGLIHVSVFFQAQSSTMYTRATSAAGTIVGGGSKDFSSFLQLTNVNQQFISMFPFDRTQTKYLSADVTSTGDIADLQFNNLVVGKWYEISGQIQSNVATTTNQIDFRSAAAGGGTLYGEYLHSANDQMTTGVSFKFKAVSSSFYANASTLSLTVFGDGTAGETYLQLTELNTTQETDQF